MEGLHPRKAGVEEHKVGGPGLLPKVLEGKVGQLLQHWRLAARLDDALVVHVVRREEAHQYDHLHRAPRINKATEKKTQNTW